MTASFPLLRKLTETDLADSGLGEQLPDSRFYAYFGNGLDKDETHEISLHPDINRVWGVSRQLRRPELGVQGNFEFSSLRKAAEFCQQDMATWKRENDKFCAELKRRPMKHPLPGSDFEVGKVGTIGQLEATFLRDAELFGFKKTDLHRRFQHTANLRDYHEVVLVGFYYASKKATVPTAVVYREDGEFWPEGVNIVLRQLKAA